MSQDDNQMSAKQPNTEEPKTETPKTEEPKTENPKAEESKTETPKAEESKPFDITTILAEFKKEQQEQLEKIKNLEEKLSALSEEKKQLVANHNDIEWLETQKKKICEEKVKNFIASLPETKSDITFNTIRIIYIGCYYYMIFYYEDGKNDNNYMKLVVQVARKSDLLLKTFGFVPEEAFAGPATLASAHVELHKRNDKCVLAIVSHDGKTHYGFYNGNISINERSFEFLPKELEKFIL